MESRQLKGGIISHPPHLVSFPHCLAELETPNPASYQPAIATVRHRQVNMSCACDSASL